MLKDLKNIIIIVLLVGLIAAAVKLFFFPEIKTEVKVKYIKGTTHTTHREIKPVVITNLEAWNVVIPAQVVFVDSSGAHNASAEFNLGVDTLGVSGKVDYKEPNFAFSSLAYRYPRETKTQLRVDTLKIETTKYKSFGYGLQATAGWDPFNNTPAIVIGIGFNFNLGAL